MRILYLILAVLVIACLVGVAGGIAYGNITITFLCMIGIILFMWLGFFTKAKQQRVRESDHN
ncbi:MAG: hypothetical protein ACE3JK_12605 [Sporolactobacillus sp.]